MSADPPTREPAEPAPSAESGPLPDGLSRRGGMSSAEFDRLLASLERAMAEAQGVDPVRVEALRSALQRGEYRCDPGAIADALLAMERILKP